MNSPKPDWLRVSLPSGQEYFEVAKLLKRGNLHTVCQEANCPNIAECFGRRTATFMILGDTCTRSCGYCNVRHGRPRAVDSEEPKRVARAVRELGLRYAVVTSVTRDDLDDGGAGVFAETIREIRIHDPECRIEVLIPDLGGDGRALQKVTDAKPDIINHNIEVVERLFPAARPQGDYQRSLNLLKEAKKCSVTKSGFMLGLGETGEEVVKTMEDLCSVTNILTIGQYLQPTRDHLPVVRYYTPKEFDEFKEIGEGMGFRHVESGPLVRSSYHAREYGIQTS
jgi:lipoic acid synthetase